MATLPLVAPYAFLRICPLTRFAYVVDSVNSVSTGRFYSFCVKRRLPIRPPFSFRTADPLIEGTEGEHCPFPPVPSRLPVLLPYAST